MFTGVSDRYEPPETPDLRLDPNASPSQWATRVLDSFYTLGAD